MRSPWSCGNVLNLDQSDKLNECELSEKKKKKKEKSSRVLNSCNLGYINLNKYKLTRTN